MMAKQNRIILLFLLLLAIGNIPAIAANYLLNISANNKGIIGVYQLNGVAIPNAGSVTAGNTYRVIATCSDENYLFDHLEITGGHNVVIEDKEKGQCTFVVSGTGSVTVKAIFVGKPQTIELKAPEAGQGTYSVICNGKKIQDKGTVPYGSAVTVIAEPSIGYSVESIRANDKQLADKEEVVILEKTIVEVVFKKIEEVSVTYGFIPISPSPLLITAEVDGKKISSGDKIPFDSELKIKIVDNWGYKFLFLVNGEEKELFQEKINEYQYTVKAVEDIDIKISQYKNKGVVSAFIPALDIIYDGAPKKYTGYRLIPEGLKDSNIKIEYQQTNPKGELTEIPPTEVGTYNVYLNREEDALFRPYRTLSFLKGRLTIHKIKTNISRLPVLSEGFLSEGIAIANNKVVKGTFKLVEGTQTEQVVKVEFIPEDEAHFTTSCCWIPVNSEINKFRVKKNLHPNGISFRILNGDYEVKDDEYVAAGTILDTEILSLPKDKKIRTYLNQISEISAEEIEMPYTLQSDLSIVLDVMSKDELQDLKITLASLEQESEYTGGGLQFKTSSLGKYIDGNKSKSVDATAWIITYKDTKTGKTVMLPCECGEYEVSLFCPGTDIYKSYTGKGLFTITQAKPSLVDFSSLKYTAVATGQALKYSTLSGGSASVSGLFTWERDDLSAINGSRYKVLFTPKNANYEVVSGELSIETSFVPFLLVDKQGNGSVNILNKTTGVQLKSGDWISAGDELIITANPDNGYSLQTLNVNDYSISSGSSYFVGDKPLAIEAVFEGSSVSYYTVTIPEVTGAIISNTGTNSVKEGNGFSFMIDYDLLYGAPTVTAGGKKLAYDGSYTYTLTKITKDTTVAISLPKYGHYEITTSVDTTLAKISIESFKARGQDATTGYTYGVDLKLTALPVDGVRFDSWWDGNSDNPRIYTVRSKQEISANFRGIPTNVETVTKPVDVNVVKNTVYIQTSSKCSASIIDMQGKVVYQLTVEGFASCKIPQSGIYIVVLTQDKQPILKKKVRISQY